MPSGVTEPLYNGEQVTFPEFAARTARIVGPWIGYEREAPLDTPLPDAFESPTDHYEKRFHDSAVALAEVVSWTPEQAEQEAHRTNLDSLKAHLRAVRASRTHLRQYEYMSTQVAAWVAPTEEHEEMRTVMQAQLDDTFGYDRDYVYKEPPKKVTGEELRARTAEFLAADVLRAEARMGEQTAYLEQASAFASEFKQSLEGWEDVPVPRRELP